MILEKNTNKNSEHTPYGGRGYTPNRYATIPTVAQNSFEVGS